MSDRCDKLAFRDIDQAFRETKASDRYDTLTFRDTELAFRDIGLWGLAFRIDERGRQGLVGGGL